MPAQARVARAVDEPAATEQVSASSQETSASARQIATAASALADTAQDLASLVGRFRVSGNRLRQFERV